MLSMAAAAALAGCGDAEGDLERAGEAIESEAKQAAREAERAGEKAWKETRELGKDVADGAESLLITAGENAKDAWITSKVKLALLEALEADALSIDVSTEDGVVTLTGELEDADALPHARKAAMEIEGVTSIQPMLTFQRSEDGSYTAGKVSQELEGEFADAKLHARVRAALLQELGAEAATLRINAEGSRATVFGTVDTPTEKNRAIETVKQTAGVADTVDRLKVDA